MAILFDYFLTLGYDKNVLKISNYLAFFLFYSKNKITQKQTQTLLFQSKIHFVDSKTLQARIIWHQRQTALRLQGKFENWKMIHNSSHV